MENNKTINEPDATTGKPKKDGKVEISTYVGTWIIVAALTVIVFLLYYAIIRPAMEATASTDPSKPFAAGSIPIAKVFMVLFLMLGPFKIIGPFAQIIQGADALLTIKIAFRAIFVSALALLLAAFLGETLLSRYGIPIPILGIAGGLILLLVALVNIIQQFKPAVAQDKKADATTFKAAMAFAFPTIVTPYGIAALIVFLALRHDNNSRLVIGVIVLTILLINLFFMLITRYVYRFLGIVLQILAAVLGIIQVALGCQVINNSLRELLK